MPGARTSPVNLLFLGLREAAPAHWRRIDGTYPLAKMPDTKFPDQYLSLNLMPGTRAPEGIFAFPTETLEPIPHGNLYFKTMPKQRFRIRSGWH
jgi:hypothetical protein